MPILDFEDKVFVRSHMSLHDRLARPVRCIRNNNIAETALVDGEHDARSCLCSSKPPLLYAD